MINNRKAHEGKARIDEMRHRKVLSRIPVPRAILERLDDLRDSLQHLPYETEEEVIHGYVAQFQGSSLYNVLKPLAEVYLAHSRTQRDALERESRE